MSYRSTDTGGRSRSTWIALVAFALIVIALIVLAATYGGGGGGGSGY